MKNVKSWWFQPQGSVHQTMKKVTDLLIQLAASHEEYDEEVLKKILVRYKKKFVIISKTREVFELVRIHLKKQRKKRLSS